MTASETETSDQYSLNNIRKNVLELEDHEGLGFHLGSSVRKKEGQKEVLGRKITTARNLQKTQSEKVSRKKHHLGLFRTRSFQKSRKQKTSERNQRQRIRRNLKELPTTSGIS